MTSRMSFSGEQIAEMRKLGQQLARAMSELPEDAPAVMQDAYDEELDLLAEGHAFMRAPYHFKGTGAD